MTYDKPANPEKGIVTVYRNQFKTQDNHPDITGSVLIPHDLIRTLYEEGESNVSLGGTEFLKLRLALWESEDADEKTPLAKGSLTRPQQKKQENNTSAPKAKLLKKLT